MIYGYKFKCVDNNVYQIIKASYKKYRDDDSIDEIVFVGDYLSCLDYCIKNQIEPNILSELHMRKGIKHDQDKLQLSLLPFDALENVTKVLEHGAKKYSRDGWRKVPNAKQRYTDALLRHISLMLQGEEIDKDSDLPHIDHIACNALFLSVLGEKND